MKKTILLISSLLIGISAYCQAPQFINFQGIVQDANGKCLQVQSIQLELTIYEGDPANNMIVYEENHTTTTDSMGLFAIRIGAGTVPPPGTYVFADIDWSSPKSVRTEVNGTFLGIVPLQSVPYAFFADNGKTTVMGNEVLHFLNSSKDTTVSILSSNADGLGEIQVFGENKKLNASIGPLSSSNPNNGYLQLNDSNGINKVNLWVDPDNRGHLSLGTAGGSLNPVHIFSDGNDNGFMNIFGQDGAFQFGYEDVDGKNPSFALISRDTVVVKAEVNSLNQGVISVRNHSGKSRIQLESVASVDVGQVLIRGANNMVNVGLSANTSATNGANLGRVTVNDTTGARKAWLEVDSNGDGVIMAMGPNGGVKNFVMPHPKESEKNIVYACIEGPEAGAYTRGTAKLVNGEAEIRFSEHFEIVANPETMTFSLTPRSASSRGLAIIEHTGQVFKVKELAGGTGFYSFDWEVKAVRKGHEDYQVIRDRLPHQINDDK